MTASSVSSSTESSTHEQVCDSSDFVGTRPNDADPDMTRSCSYPLSNLYPTRPRLVDTALRPLPLANLMAVGLTRSLPPPTKTYSTSAGDAPESTSTNLMSRELAAPVLASN